MLAKSGGKSIQFHLLPPTTFYKASAMPKNIYSIANSKLSLPYLNGIL